MKKITALCLILFATLNSNAQLQTSIKWSASYKAISATEGEISINAIIDKGWHTYSQQANDAVPLPTLFSFKESKEYQLIGKTEESNAHEEFDAALNEKLSVFTGSADFKQKVKLNVKSPQTIAFKVEYILCDNSKCLPPTTIDLSVKTQ